MFREVVLFLRAVNEDVDKNEKVFKILFAVSDKIVFAISDKILFAVSDKMLFSKLLIKGEEPARPIRHQWGESSSLSTVLCEFKAITHGPKYK